MRTKLLVMVGQAYYSLSTAFKSPLLDTDPSLNKRHNKFKTFKYIFFYFRYGVLIHVKTRRVR